MAEFPNAKRDDCRRFGDAGAELAAQARQAFWTDEERRPAQAADMKNYQQRRALYRGLGIPMSDSCRTSAAAVAEDHYARFDPLGRQARSVRRGGAEDIASAGVAGGCLCRGEQLRGRGRRSAKRVATGLVAGAARARTRRRSVDRTRCGCKRREAFASTVSAAFTLSGGSRNHPPYRRGWRDAA